MAENTDNKNLYWVRTINPDGDYNYYNATDTDIPELLKEYPNAQGMMRQADGKIMPFALNKIDMVKNNPNMSLLDLTHDEVKNYDYDELTYVRPYREAYEAFDSVMQDHDVSPDSALYELMVGTFGYETSFGAAGRKGVGGKGKAKGLMQITLNTFNDLKNRYYDQYVEICDKYNEGKDIKHEDLEKPEFDKAAVDFGYLVMADKLATAYRKEGIDITSPDFDRSLIPHIYAKYYNTGDKQQKKDKNGKLVYDAKGNPVYIGHTVDEHTKLFAEALPGFMDRYTSGRRYYKNYNNKFNPDWHKNEIQEKTMIEENVVENIEVTNEPVISVQDNKEANRAKVQEIVDRVSAEENQKIHDTSYDYNNVVSKVPNITATMKESFEFAPRLYDKVTDEVNQMVHSEIESIAQEKTNQVFKNDKEYQELDTIAKNMIPEGEIEKALSELANGIPADATPEEKLKYIEEQSQKIAQSNQEMMEQLTPEQKDEYDMITSTLQDAWLQEYQLQYDELYTDKMGEYQEYINDALTKYYKPQSDVEYAAVNALTQSYIGKLMLSNTNADAKDMLNQGLAEYNAGGVLNILAGASAIMLDMPLFSAGGAIGGAIFKAGAGVVNAFAQRAILTAVSKGKNIANTLKIGKALNATAKASEATMQTYQRVAKMRLNQWGTGKWVAGTKTAANMLTSGYSSWAFHDMVSQHAYNNFDITKIDFQSVHNSGLLGAVMSPFQPFKEAVPSVIQKRIGLKVLQNQAARATSTSSVATNTGKNWLKKSATAIAENVFNLNNANRSLQALSRAAFIATIEAPLFDLASRVTSGNGATGWNYIHAMKEHTGLFLGLGASHLFKPANIGTKKGKVGFSYEPKDYYGISSPFRNLANTPNARLDVQDFKNMSDITGFEIKGIADIRKLNKAELVEFDKAMMSKDMPISTRNKYALMSGESSSVYFTLPTVNGDKSVETVEITKDKNGGYIYQSFNAEGSLLERKTLYGYSEAEAMAFGDMSRNMLYTIRTISMREVLDDSYIPQTRLALDSEMKKAQSEVLKKVQGKDGKSYSDWSAFEADVVKALEKDNLNLRTDREVELINSYNEYIAEYSEKWATVASAVESTAVACDVPVENIRQVLKLQPEQRTGTDADIYEVFDAFVNGRDIPQNETILTAEKNINTAIEQVNSGKIAPEQLTPTQEAVWMGTMTESQRIAYLNRKFTSADGTVEYVEFSDGFAAVRVVEETGSAIFRDLHGRDIKLTDAQMREYETKTADVLTGTSAELNSYILEAQAERIGFLRRSSEQTYEDVEGTIEYRKEDGSLALGEARTIQLNGDYILTDGTIVKSDAVTFDRTSFVADKVDAILQGKVTPEGFVESERPTQKQLSSMRSKNPEKYIADVKRWNPDENLLPELDGLIANQENVIAKAHGELAKADEIAKTGQSMDNTRALLNKRIADATQMKENLIKLREQYEKDYPIDKANYDANLRELEAKAKAEAEAKAKAEAEALKQRQEENIRIAREKKAQQEAKEAKKAEQAEFNREFKILLREEAKEQKRLAKENSKEYQDKKLWDETRKKHAEIKRERERQSFFDKLFTKILDSYNGQKAYEKAKQVVDERKQQEKADKEYAEKEAMYSEMLGEVGKRQSREASKKAAQELAKQRKIDEYQDFLIRDFNNQIIERGVKVAQEELARKLTYDETNAAYQELFTKGLDSRTGQKAYEKAKREIAETKEYEEGFKALEETYDMYSEMFNEAGKKIVREAEAKNRPIIEALMKRNAKQSEIESAIIQFEKDIIDGVDKFNHKKAAEEQRLRDIEEKARQKSLNEQRKFEESLEKMSGEKIYSYMDSLLNPLSPRWNINEFHARLEQFLADLSPTQKDMTAFRMMLKNVQTISAYINKQRINLDRGLTSSDPRKLLTSRLNQSKIEEGLMVANERMHELVSTMHTFAEKLETVGFKEAPHVLRQVIESLGNNRPIAKDIVKLLDPKPEPKPIITEVRSSTINGKSVKSKAKVEDISKKKIKPQEKSNVKEENIEKTKETEKIESEKTETQVEVAPTEELVDIPVDLTALDINSELTQNLPQERDAVIEPVKTQTPEVIKESDVRTAERVEITPETTVDASTQDSVPALKEDVAPAPKPKRKAKISAKIREVKKAKEVALKTEEKIATELEKPVNQEDLQKVEITLPKEDITPEVEVPVQQTEALVTNEELSQVRTAKRIQNNGLEFKITQKDGTDVKVVEGKRGSKDGWTELAIVEVSIEGLADNNSIGDTYDVLTELFVDTESGSNRWHKQWQKWNVGDEIFISQNPVMKVEITYDGKGGRRITHTEVAETGSLSIHSLRNKADNPALSQISNRLKKNGIKVVWGNAGDFSNRKQSAFYDAKRREIVLNELANLSEYDALSKVLGHESVHGMLDTAMYSDKDRNNIIRVISEIISNETGMSNWNDMITERQSYYKDALGRDITQRQAELEIIADFFGEKLFAQGQDATQIRDVYKSLKDKESRLSNKIKSNDGTNDMSVLRNELQATKSAIAFIEKMAKEYNSTFVKKVSVLGEAFESFANAINDILGISKAHKREATWNDDFSNKESLKNVWIHAEKRTAQEYGKDFTLNDVYSHIWRNQDIEPYYKEYIEARPDKFAEFKNVPYPSLFNSRGEFNRDVSARIEENEYTKLKNDPDKADLVKKEYREQKGLDPKARLTIKDKDKQWGTFDTLPGLLQVEAMFKMLSTSNYAFDNAFLKSRPEGNFGDSRLFIFREKFPKTYDRLVKEYGIDPLKGKEAAYDVELVLGYDVNTKGNNSAPSKKQKAKNSQSAKTTEQNENDARISALLTKIQEHYDNKPTESDEIKTLRAEVDALSIEKIFGKQKYAQLTPAQKLEWADAQNKKGYQYDRKAKEAELNQALKEFKEKEAEWAYKTEELAAELAQLQGGYDAYSDKPFHVSKEELQQKLKETKDTFKLIIQEMKLSSKNREDFVREVYRAIVDHIQSNPTMDAFRGKSDVKKLLQILKNAATNKNVSLADRVDAVEKIATELDFMAKANHIDNLVDNTKENIKTINVRMVSGMHKSDKYASPEKVAYMEAAKDGLKTAMTSKNPDKKTIDDKIIDIQDEIQLLQDKIDNGTYSAGEDENSIRTKIVEKQRAQQGYSDAKDLMAMHKQKNATLNALTQNYNLALRELKAEKMKAHPDVEKLKSLRQIIDNYNNDREWILDDYLKKARDIADKFIDIEKSAKLDLESLRNSQKEYTEKVIENFLNDYYGDTYSAEMPVNSVEYQAMMKGRKAWASKLMESIKEAGNYTWGSLDYMLSEMTVSRRSNEGSLRKDVASWFAEAENTKNKVRDESLKLYYKLANEVFGDVGQYYVSRKSQKLLVDSSNNKVTLDRYEYMPDAMGTGMILDKSGYKVATNNKHGYLSIGEAVDIILASEQTKGMISLQRAGIREQDVLHLKNLMNSNPEYKKFLELGYKYRDNLVKYVGSEAQKVHLAEFGLKFIEETNYFPLSIATTRASDGSVIKSRSFSQASLRPGYLISRVSQAGEYRISNAFDKVIDYTMDMAHWTGFSPMSRKINAVLGNERVARIIKANEGEQFYTRLKRMANLTVGTLSTANAFNSKIWNAAYSAAKTSKIALRPLTAVKQLTSGFAFAGYSADPIYQAMLLKEYAKTSTNMGWSAIQWCNENLPRFKARWEGGAGGELFMGDLRSVHADYLSEVRNKATKVGLFMNSYADALTVATGSKAVYEYSMRKLRKAGVSEDTARKLSILEAEQEFNLTQASSETLYLSEAQGATSNILWKGAMAFTNPILSLWRRQLQNTTDLKRLTFGGNGMTAKEFRSQREKAYTQKYIDMGLTPEEARKAASRDVKADVFADLLGLAGGAVLANFSFDAVGILAKARAAKQAGDDESYLEIMDSLWDSLIQRATTGGLMDVPVAGDAIAIVKGMIEGKNPGKLLEETFGEAAGGILGSVLSDAYKISKSLFSDSDKERFESIAHLCSLPLMLVLKVDPKTFINYYKAVVAAVDGEFDKSLSYAFQLPPSALKLFEEISESPQANLNFRNKYGMSKTDLAKRSQHFNANRSKHIDAFNKMKNKRK